MHIMLFFSVYYHDSTVLIALKLEKKNNRKNVVKLSYLRSSEFVFAKKHYEIKIQRRRQFRLETTDSEEVMKKVVYSE